METAVKYQAPHIARLMSKIASEVTEYRITEFVNTRLAAWAKHRGCDKRDIAYSCLKAFKNRNNESVVLNIRTLDTTGGTDNKTTMPYRWSLPILFLRAGDNEIDSRLFNQIVIWHTDNAGGMPKE